MSQSLTLHPIGVIRSVHTEPEKTPIQPMFAQDCIGTVVVDEKYLDALADIDRFSHLYLIYWLHKAGPVKLKLKPFLSDDIRGLFATRAPSRPNPIGMSIVELISRDENILDVRGVDILDGTPLLDIKPYTERFDNVQTRRNGWQDRLDDETAERLGRRNYQPAPPVPEHENRRKD